MDVQAEIRINLCYRRQKVKIKEFLGKVYTLPKNEQIYFPTHRLDISLASRKNDPDKLAALIESQSPIYSAAFEDISDYLTNLKQRKDNRPKENT